MESIKHEDMTSDHFQITDKQKIKLETFDNLFYDYEDNFIVKMDTEGFELNILEGATKTLKHKKGIWVIETHEETYQLKNRKKDVINYMIKYGFELVKEVFDHSGSKVFFIAKK